MQPIFISRLGIVLKVDWCSTFMVICIYYGLTTFCRGYRTQIFCSEERIWLVQFMTNSVYYCLGKAIWKKIF